MMIEFYMEVVAMNTQGIGKNTQESSNDYFPKLKEKILEEKITKFIVSIEKDVPVEPQLLKNEIKKYFENNPLKSPQVGRTWIIVGVNYEKSPSREYDSKSLEAFTVGTSINAQNEISDIMTHTIKENISDKRYIQFRERFDVMIAYEILIDLFVDEMELNKDFLKDFAYELSKDYLAEYLIENITKASAWNPGPGMDNRFMEYDETDSILSHKNSQ